MLKKIIIFSLCLSVSVSVSAGCDFKKATRNKILDEKVGVSGKCNAGEAAKQQILDSTGKLLNTDTKEMQHQIEDSREQTKDRINEIKPIQNVSIKKSAGTVKK